MPRLAVVYGFTRDDNHHFPRYPGRVAVRGGCGLRHTFFNGDDPRFLCLPGLWAETSVSRNGEKLAYDTGTGLTIANADGFNPVAIPVPPGANFDPSLSPDAKQVAFLHSPEDDGRYDLWIGSTTIDNAEQVTNTRDVSSVAWSPDGDWIAYVQGWSEITGEGRDLPHPSERGRRDAARNGRLARRGPPTARISRTSTAAGSGRSTRTGPTCRCSSQTVSRPPGRATAR